MTEQTKYWRDSDLGFDLLHATYVKHSFAPHTHEGYVIGVIEGGVETFRYQKAVHYAPRNHTVIVNPNEVHTGSAAHEKGWTYRTFYPPTEVLSAIHKELGLPYLPSFPKAVIYDLELAEQLRWFHHASETNVSLLERSTALFGALRTLIVRHADVRTDNSRLRTERRKVKEVRAYLEAYAAHEVRLEHLADKFELSPSHLLRTFRKEVGLTPHAYQVQRRVEEAKRLLAQGDALTQVALEVGFYDQSHLGKYFKRIVGVTPAQFVKGVQASAISS